MAKRKAITEYFPPGKAPTPALDGPKSFFASDEWFVCQIKIAGLNFALVR